MIASLPLGPLKAPRFVVTVSEASVGLVLDPERLALT